MRMYEVELIETRVCCVLVAAKNAKEARAAGLARFDSNDLTFEFVSVTAASVEDLGEDFTP